MVFDLVRQNIVLASARVSYSILLSTRHQRVGICSPDAMD